MQYHDIKVAGAEDPRAGSGSELEEEGMKDINARYNRAHGKWAFCDVCKKVKEGVQIRKKFLKDMWVCNDCYKLASAPDAGGVK